MATATYTPGQKIDLLLAWADAHPGKLMAADTLRERNARHDRLLTYERAAIDRMFVRFHVQAWVDKHQVPVPAPRAPTPYTRAYIEFLDDA
jgi:hypothetical protein